jgi:replicative DNA helicase
MSLPLPQALEVERCVLGDMLVTSSSSNFEGIREDHFSDRRNKLIFQAFVMMESKGEKPDHITITNKLKDLGLLDQVGGSNYVAGLPYLMTNVAADQYVPILDEKAKLRKIIEISDQASKQAYENIESLRILKTLELSAFCLESNDNSGSLTQKAVAEVLASIALKKTGERSFGLKTGIPSIDTALGGLKPSRYVVLAARAGKGKTAIMEQIITTIILSGKPILIVEKDMSPALLISRMACRMAKVPFYKLDNQECSIKEYDEIEKWVKVLDKTPLYIYSPSDFTPSALVSLIKREKKQNDIKAVFVDHILNLKISGDYRLGLTVASTMIRASVEETEIPHFILAQLNREGHGNERPSPKHIKEFDALYADCDAMMMLWSEKDTHDVPPGQLFPVKLTCNKNRYGSEFEDELGFDRPLMTFKPMINHK